MENVNTSPKSKDVETTIDADVSMNREVCAFDANSKGIVYLFMSIIDSNAMNYWEITYCP